DYYSKFFGRDVLNSPPETDRAFIGNYQTLGYLRGNRMVLLHPKRQAEVLSVDADMNIVQAVSDPVLVREASAFYSAASHVFRSGLYRDEEQIAPDERAAAKLRDGSW